MNLFILDYVPDDETAFVVADAFVEARVRDLYEQFLQDENDHVYRVASELANATKPINQHSS